MTTAQSTIRTGLASVSDHPTLECKDHDEYQQFEFAALQMVKGLVAQLGAEFDVVYERL